MELGSSARSWARPSTACCRTWTRPAATTSPPSLRSLCSHAATGALSSSVGHNSPTSGALPSGGYVKKSGQQFWSFFFHSSSKKKRPQIDALPFFSLYIHYIGRIFQLVQSVVVEICCFYCAYLQSQENYCRARIRPRGPDSESGSRKPQKELWERASGHQRCCLLLPSVDCAQTKPGFDAC